MRSLASASVCLLAAIASGCAAAPAAPTPGPTAPTLAAGNYALRVDPDAVPGTPSFCATNGASTKSANLPVTVTTDGTVWTVRPSSEADRGLVITMRIDGATFDGTASGRALDGTTIVIFGTEGTTPQPARLSGSPQSPNVVTGAMTGSVAFESAGGSALCTGYAWSLQPR